MSLFASPACVYCSDPTVWETYDACPLCSAERPDSDAEGRDTVPRWVADEDRPRFEAEPIAWSPPTGDGTL